MPDRKTFAPFEFKLDEAGSVTVAFSRFGVIDSDGDVTFAGAMPIGKSVPISAYGHTSWDGALPVGKGTVDEHGDLAILSGSFFMETDQGRNAHATVKAMGDLQEWSYGYAVLPPSGPGIFDGQRVRELRALDVYEVSPVLKGAGVGTHTLAIKSGALGSGAPYADHLDWVLAEVKALADRSSDRAEWRAKEGRVLSAANRERLVALRVALAAVGVDLDDLLAATEPVDPAQQAAVAKAAMDNLLAIARANGIRLD